VLRRARLGTTRASSASSRRASRERAASSPLRGRAARHRYQPPFPFFAGRERAPGAGADYVTTDDGTGIVHIAPAFGEEDKVVTDAAGIEVVVPVDARRQVHRRGAAVRRAAGVRREQAIVADLKATRRAHVTGHAAAAARDLRPPVPALLALRQPADLPRGVVVVRQGDGVQGPHGRAQPADHLGADHIKDGSFGKWLENARDWSISRNRYWGSPIPVWVSDDPAYPRVDVYGSLDELERTSASGRTTCTGPYVDDLTRPEPRRPRPGRSTMRRVPGGARLLVRVRLDAVRPGALPVRERGLVRAPLPR
jgi:isoleucyl-tRNA synthetase